MPGVDAIYSSAPLDNQLVAGNRPPTEATRIIRVFAISCVVTVIAQACYSFFTTLALVRSGPSGIYPVVVGMLATASLIGGISIPLLYKWKTLGWCLAAGFFTFQASFLLLLGNRYLFFGEIFSLTDLAETYLQSELLLDIVMALLASYLPLLLCWRPTVRKAFGVRTSTAVVVVTLGLFLRMLFFAVTYLIYQEQ